MDPRLIADKEEKELVKHSSWRLRTFLGTDQNLDDLIYYMLDIEDDEKTRQYIMGYVKSSVPEERFQEAKLRTFTSDMLNRRRKIRGLRKQADDRIRKPQKVAIEGYKAYRKEDAEPDAGIMYAGEKEKPRMKLSKKERKAEREREKQEQDFANYLEARRICDCQAAKHPLLGNCMQCGKISCAEEGEGPCLFCGAYANEEWVGTELKQHPGDRVELSNAQEEALRIATERRDKLLDFERNSAARTMVLDDQEDYFTFEENRWLSKAERASIRKQAKAFREKKEEDKHKITFSIDIGNRKLVAEEATASNGDSATEEVFVPDMEEVAQLEAKPVVKKQTAPGQRSFTNPFLACKAPKFVGPKGKKQKAGVLQDVGNEGRGPLKGKVQHSFFSSES